MKSKKGGCRPIGGKLTRVRNTNFNYKIMEDCKHDQGSYIDKEDMSHDVVERCNLCDMCLNLSEKEYNEGDGDTGFFDDDVWDDEPW